MQLADIYLWFVYLVSRLFDMLIQKMAPLSLIFEHLSSNNCILYKATEVRFKQILFGLFKMQVIITTLCCQLG